MISCRLSGIIGIGMLMATFFTMSVSTVQEQNLRKKLSADANNTYDGIILERRNLYFQGLLLGLFISYWIVSGIHSNNFHKITLFLAISIPISVLFYSLMPKSDYMLRHLSTKEEIEAWLDVYLVMKTRYILGFIFGSLAAIPLSYSLCGVRHLAK